MHLLVPFAATESDGGRAALRSLALPRLSAWLRRARRVAGEAANESDALSLSPPHEQALAAAWGWAGADGLLPFAAVAAHSDGLDTASAAAWCQLTPVHWHLGTEQISMADPATLMLDESGARVLFEAVAPLFSSEGFGVVWGTASRWYLTHPMLAGVPMASIDRVIGRNVDRWLIAGREGRLLRRLQNEVQMLLHSHAENAAREARGLLPVNSVWISGGGVTQAQAGNVQIEARLRAGALAEDWAAWCKAWDSLDAAWPEPLTRLTLCGERSWASFEPARGFMNSLRSLAASGDARALLETL